MINQFTFGLQRKFTNNLCQTSRRILRKCTNSQKYFQKQFSTTTTTKINNTNTMDPQNKQQKELFSTIFTCVPGKEFELSKEISKKISIPEESLQIIKPGILQGPHVETKIPDLVFALQILPSALKFVDQWSLEIPSNIVDKKKPIIFHTLVPKMMKGNYKRSAVKHRCDNVMQNLIKQFSTKYPNTKFKKSTKLSWNKDSGVLLCQLLNLDKGNFLISFSEPEPILHSHWPSFYIGGLQDIHMELPKSPNSAFRKLQEAFWCLGKFPKPRDYVADFGGAPGGWAMLSLTYGANVFSLDKAPLEVKHKNLNQKRGDAFTFEPPFIFANGEEKIKIDWLLWDVICEPQKFLDFLQKHCEAKTSKYIIGNFKFQGEIDWEAINEAQKIGEENGYEVRLKHFFNNKNEVCCLMEDKG